MTQKNLQSKFKYNVPILIFYLNKHIQTQKGCFWPALAFIQVCYFDLVFGHSFLLIWSNLVYSTSLVQHPSSLNPGCYNSKTSAYWLLQPPYSCLLVFTTPRLQPTCYNNPQTSAFWLLQAPDSSILIITPRLQSTCFNNPHIPAYWFLQPPDSSLLVITIPRLQPIGCNNPQTPVYLF